MRAIKKICTLILFFSLSAFSQEEEKQIDSLHKLYQKNQFNDLLKAKNCAQEAVLLSAKINTDSLILISNYYLTEALYKQRKIKEAKKSINFTKLLSEKTNNQKYLCLSHLYLGNIHRRLGNYTKGLKNLEKGYFIAKKHNFVNEQHQIINSKAILLKKTKNSEKAINLLKNILKKNYYNNSYTLANTYSSLGSLYFKYLEDKDSSAYFYKKGIRLIRKSNNDYLKTILYLNYGDLLLQSNKQDEALNFLQLAEKTANKNSDYASLFFINSSLGIYFDDQKKKKKAIKKYKKAITQYGEYADGNQIANLYWLLSGAMYCNNQYKDGFLYQEKLIYLKDSLFTIEKNKTFEKLQTEFEVEKKNTKIQLLEKDKELEVNKRNLILSIGSFILIALILLIFVFRYRVKSQKLIRKQEQKLHQQEKEQLEQEQRIKHIEGFIEGEEKEKNRIAMELHDGIGGKLAGMKHFVSTLTNTNETVVLSKNLKEVTKEVRLLSHSLSYTYGLKQSLKNLLEELKEQYKNHFTFEIVLYPENKISKISNEKKLFLYRTIQELVNNTYKHAKANSISISLTVTDELLLMVEDDGIGFNLATKLNGIGLQNIKEKLVKFNGKIEIDTTKNTGTTIIIKLPK